MSKPATTASSWSGSWPNGATRSPRHWARPAAVTHAMVTGTDLLRSRAQLLAENALLRQQLIVLRRSDARPILNRPDRALLVLLAGRVRAWRQALLIVRLTPCCAGTARGSARSGDGSRARGRPARRSRQRPSP